MQASDLLNNRSHVKTEQLVNMMDPAEIKKKKEIILLTDLYLKLYELSLLMVSFRA